MAATTPTFSVRDKYHPQYFVRDLAQGITVAGTGNPGARLLAGQLLKVHNAVLAVTAQGSATAGVIDLISVTGTGGTTTTTLATVAIGTATVYSTYTQGLLGAGNFASMLQRGEMIYATSRLDNTLTCAVSWEVGFPDYSQWSDPALHLP